MKRYNIVGGPKEMEESSDGYWVTFDDYNLLSLDCNKSLERSWNIDTETQEKIRQANSEILEKQQNIIIGLSIACFFLSSYLLFKLLS